MKKRFTEKKKENKEGKNEGKECRSKKKLEDLAIGIASIKAEWKSPKSVNCNKSWICDEIACRRTNQEEILAGEEMAEEKNVKRKIIFKRIEILDGNQRH